MQYSNHLLFLALTSVVLGACGGSNDATEITTDAAEPAVLSSADKAAASNTSPGKPGAPITFSYKIVGTPIVGQPLAIDVFVTSSGPQAGPVRVSYRVNDASSMTFPASQALQTEFAAKSAGAAPRSQQITVIPQKEGRLYLNVSAEVMTPTGSMLKTQAIPIQVGAAPLELKSAGELKEDADGEQVISLPSS